MARGGGEDLGISGDRVQGSSNWMLTGWLAILAGLAGGCSTMTDLAGIPHPGHQPDGGYVLLASERDLDCRRLANEVELGLKEMETAKARINAERDALPTTLVSVYGRMFGGPEGGLKNAENYRKSEQRVRALNEQLGARECRAIDVDARIMAFDLAPMNAAKTNGADGAPVTTAAVPSAQSQFSQPRDGLKAESMTALSPFAQSR